MSKLARGSYHRQYAHCCAYFHAISLFSFYLVSRTVSVSSLLSCFHSHHISVRQICPHLSVLSTLRFLIGNLLISYRERKALKGSLKATIGVRSHQELLLRNIIDEKKNTFYGHELKKYK